MRIALTLLLLASAAPADDPKLQPLKYNHPGLVVDLGVGLWAWPLPMDFDGDGDFDLVVSCPDKPSNGFYFFENPSQDPAVKLPVFRPGVRVGSSGQNVQVSYVDGQPRVLRENFEYVGFLGGKFEARQKIYPTADIHGSTGSTRAKMWRYIDWEGDGDQDLVAGIGDWADYGWDHAYDSHGRWRNGPLHGWVYLIENDGGSYSKPPVKIEAAGQPVDVFGWPSPNFADFDGDGDLDLLCGEFLDGFNYFENTGTRADPRFAAGVKLQASDGKPLVMHLQMITPTALDWDRDGDIDLIVGDEDGRVALVENVSPPRARLPVFLQPRYFQQEADELKFGALATPFAHDWDGDGDEDIVCGNTAGNIAWFENLDGRGTRWSAPELLEVDGKPFRILAGADGSIQGPAEAKWGYTTLSVADWDGDGRDDLVVNSIWPKLQLLRKTASGLSQGPLPFWTAEAPPAFYWWQTRAENLQTQWRTTPVATDFDRDGKLDLVILDQQGFLTCQSRARNETRIFLDEDLAPVRLNPRSAGASGRVKLAVVDWDGDGRADILTNSENAAWWRNCRDAGDGRVILKKVGNLARRNVAGHTSSPAACDFDRDGKPDLLVGSENGRIYFIRHDDCVTFPADRLAARPPQPLPPPRFAGLVGEEVLATVPLPARCRAAHLIETTRGLVAAWHGDGAARGVWTSYHDGASWSKPEHWASDAHVVDVFLSQPFADAPLTLYLALGENGAHQAGGTILLSFDRGRTFRDRAAAAEPIPAALLRKHRTIAHGGQVLQLRPGEHSLGLAVSADGKSWEIAATIAEHDGGEWSDPTMMQSGDGLVHITYTWDHRQVRHVTIDPAQLAAGTAK